MHDCFISYSHKDSSIAIAIQNLLEQQGIRCWIDFRDAIPGVNYAGAIIRAIKSCSVFILVLSQESATSVHVINEVNSAVNEGKVIIPFKIDSSELNDNMEYYIGTTHWLDALTPPLEEHILQLANMVKTFQEKEVAEEKVIAQPVVRSVEKPLFKKNECRAMKYEDLLELGYTATTISLQLVENDYINCNGIGAENEGSAQQWETYLQNNSETFQYLVNGENQIVGNWSIVALNDETFEQAMKGELLEVDLDLDKTELICFPGMYNGYILNFSLLPEYRVMRNYNIIIETYLKQLEEYAENQIFFKKWCINVFGKEIEALIKPMGFQYVTDNKVYGKIYACDFMPIPELPVYRNYKKLIEEYKNASR